MRLAARRPKEDVVVICFSGRGDKDCFEVARLLGRDASTLRYHYANIFAALRQALEKTS